MSDGLREFLAGRDVACPECGYNLRDLTTDCCPECGLALSRAMFFPQALPERAFVFGIVGLMFLALVSLVFMGQGEGYGVIGLAAAGVAIGAWLRQERWIRTRPRSVRVLLAAACWAWPLWIAAGLSLGRALGLISGR